MAKDTMNLKGRIQLDTREFKAGLKGAQTAWNQFSSTFARAISLVGVTMLGRQMVQIGKDFQDSMARVQAVSNATREEFEYMEAAARKMGETTRYTATEAADALEKLVRNGMKAKEAADALGSVLKFAQANAISLAEAADIIKITLNQFGLAASNAGKVSDILSTVASNTATNVLELHEALINAAPAAKTLGFNIEETTAALGALAQRGVKAAAAGTALRIPLQKIIDPLIVKKLREAGVEIDETYMKANGLYATLQKFSDKNLSLEQLTHIFSQKGAVQMQQMINSVEDMRYVMTQIQIASQNEIGTTERMFEQGVGTMRRELDTLKSKWESTLIATFNQSEGILVDVIRYLQTLTDMLRGGFGNALAAIATVAIPAIGAALRSVNRDITLVYGSFKKWLSSSMNWITLAITAFTELGVALYASWYKVQGPIRNAQKEVESFKYELDKTNTKVKDLSHALEIANGDYNALVKVVDKAKSLFPDFADAIDEAGKNLVNGRSSWLEFKEMLEEIALLQGNIRSKTGYENLAEAHVNAAAYKIGNYAAAGRPSGDTLSRTINEVMKDNDINKGIREGFWKQVVQLIRDNTQEDATQKIYELIKSYNLQDKIKPVGGGFLYNEKTGRGALRDMVRSWANEENIAQARRLDAQINNIDLKAAEKRFKIFNQNFDKAVKDFDMSKEKDKMRANDVATRYLETFGSMLADAGLNHWDDLSKQIQAKIDDITKKYKIKVEEIDDDDFQVDEQLTKTIEKYNKELATLNNQKAKNVLTDKQYNEKLKELQTETWETLAGFDNLDNQLKSVGEDAVLLGETLKTVFENAQADAKIAQINKWKDEHSASQYEQYKNFWGNFPEYQKRDRSNDINLDKLEIQKKDLAEKEEYLKSIKRWLDSLDPSKFADIFNYAANAINNVYIEYQKLAKEVEDEKTLIALAEKMKEAEKETKKLEKTMKSFDENFIDFNKGLGNVGNGINGVWGALKKVNDAYKDYYNKKEGFISDDELKRAELYISNLELILQGLKSIANMAQGFSKAIGVVSDSIGSMAAKKAAADKLTAASDKEAAAASLGNAVAGGAASVAKVPWIGAALAVAAAAAIATAIMSNSKKRFAHGGIVGGGSRWGDEQLVRANSGEAIITTGQQKALFNMMNNGGAGGQVQFKIQGKDLVGVLRNEKLLTTGRL